MLKEMNALHFSRDPSVDPNWFDCFEESIYDQINSIDIQAIDRADEIASTLVQLGVNKKNIQVAAVSDTQPAYYEFMMSGEAGNRRTEIYLTR